MLPRSTRAERTMISEAMNNRWSSTSLGCVLGCLLFVAALLCEAQGNLVPNPGFEEIDSCPCAIGFQPGGKPLHWEKWSQSPEYFNACIDETCALDTLLDVPMNGFGYQPAYDGNGYVGMAAFDGFTDFREHVGCELLEPLVLGQTYQVSFHTNVAFGGNYWSPSWACNNMGLLFTMEPNIWIGDWDDPPFALRNYAHLHSAAVITDTASWTLVSGNFVADSAYRYMVLGNFFSDELTDTVHVVPGPSLGAYYFVDGVCVARGGSQSCAPVGLPEQGAARYRVFPVPAVDHVEVSPAIEPGVPWEIIDLVGRTVVQGETGHVPLRIAIDGWTPGEFVLRIQGKPRQHIRFAVIR